MTDIFVVTFLKAIVIIAIAIIKILEVFPSYVVVDVDFAAGEGCLSPAELVNMQGVGPQSRESIRTF